jgi:lipopolysaccharide transport system ATP-binding protein
MSSKSEKAIDVRSLCKAYPLRSAAQKKGGPSQSGVFHALTAVSFAVAPGEVVGVVGRNGAGKSTLLKILTRITSPTVGEADLFGRVGSLLEVGTGFHPELTGRENIFLNGAILGMRRSEIRSEFDAIVAFAGVERFLETPVKRYSSGMYVRLAFAVAAHLRSEILLVDEVLAVGDIEFQKRCLGKMRDVARSGRTVLFVSHHLQSVSTLCQRLLVLESGRLVHDGEVHAGLTRYLAGFERGTGSSVQEAKRSGSGELRVTKAVPNKEFYECAEPKAVRFFIEQRASFEGRFYVSVHLVDPMGVVVAQCDSRLLGLWFEAATSLALEFRVKSPWLKPGTYRVDIYLCASGFIDQCEHACTVEVLPLLPYPATAGSEALESGMVLADFEFRSAPDAADAPASVPSFEQCRLRSSAAF